MKILEVVATYAGFFIVCSNASPAPLLNVAGEKRGACNSDNLLRALASPTRLADSYKFCSQYINVPPTTTVTVTSGSCTLSTFSAFFYTLHPLYLYNLQPACTSHSPLSYNSASPTPILVPGGDQGYTDPACNYYKGRDVASDTNAKDTEMVVMQTPTTTPLAILPQELVRRASLTTPSYIASTYPPSRLSSACSCLSVPAANTYTYTNIYYTQVTTTSCAIFTPTTTASYAAICAPSLQVNAPAPAANPGYRVTPNFSVPSKLDCCAACTSHFNCVWWKFDFGTPGDGWKPGMCHYAYQTTPTKVLSNVAVCPNGLSYAVNLTGTQIGREANNNDPGYNPGPCGGALNIFESSQDFGYPDYDNPRDCRDIPPPVYVGDGCYGPT